MDKYQLPINCFSIFLGKNDVNEIADSICKELGLYFNTKMIKEKIESHRYDYQSLQPASILEYVGIVFKNEYSNVIYTDNTNEGYISLIKNLCEKNDYQVVSCRIYENDIFPGCFFYYYNGRSIQRIIQSYKDGKNWVFYEKGPIQYFENPSNYLKRKKSERLTFEIMTEYFARLGIEILADKTFNSQSDGYWIARDQ
jgi:hypothetical protein